MILILYDKNAVMQVLGSLIQDPSKLIEEKYKITQEDFAEEYHYIIFAAINNLYFSGKPNFQIYDIDMFLSKFPKQYAIFTAHNGMDYLQRIVKLSSPENFEAVYVSLKKFTLLRKLKEKGIDITEIYDENLVAPDKVEKMIEKYEKMSINDIINVIESRIITIKSDFYDMGYDIGGQAGKGVDELLKSLEEEPEMGLPLNSKLLTTVTRGACKGKVHLISAPTGGFKTRSAVADAAFGAMTHIYDKSKGWLKAKEINPTLFITTELEMDEIQTMLLAYVANVDEEHILSNKYEIGEKERIIQAATIIKESPFWIERLSNFSMESIEATIKKYYINEKVEYVYFDYLFTSVALLSQVAQQTKGGVKLREDNVLLIFIEKLKWLAQSLGIYIRTATQLNDSYRTIGFADQSTLKACKALADKVDIGIISLPLSEKDKEMLEVIKQSPAFQELLNNKKITPLGFTGEPNICYHIYKNRRGKLCFLRVFAHYDGGTLRTTDCFATDKDYVVKEIQWSTLESQWTKSSFEIPKSTPEEPNAILSCEDTLIEGDDLPF